MKLLHRVLALALAALVLSGCMAAKTVVERPVVRATTALSAQFLTVVADVDPVVNSLAVSAALYQRSGLVVTAPVGNDHAVILAASVAVDLGVPLLLTPTFGASVTANLGAELTRLHASYVLSVGGAGRALTAESSPAPTDRAAKQTTARTVLTVPATPAGVNAVLPVPLKTVNIASAAVALSALADMDPLAPVLLNLPATMSAPDVTSAPAPGEVPELPRVTRAPPLTKGLLLATDDPAQLAGVATARAASVAVKLVPTAQPNPQASAEVIAAIGAAGPKTVIALGRPFAAEPSLAYKIRAAATGIQLPGGGQLLFPSRRFVALYGTPGTPVLGVLGEQPVTEAIARARQMAAAYQPLSDRVVVPMHEIIATVASAGAGADGNYSTEIPADQLRDWVEAAGAAGVYVVLDLQPGRTDFLTQARQYASLLALPYVGLALDPEWRLAPDQRHLAQIGSVDVSEINAVSTWLADLTNERALPQKLLVLHQFRSSMIGNRAGLDLTRPELAVLLHVDGLGGQPDKQSTWATLHADAPAGVAWGWKNFYDEDRPMLTPEQTMTQVSPVPDLITYQ